MVKTYWDELKDLVRTGLCVQELREFIQNHDIATSFMKMENKRELLFLACLFGHLHIVEWLLLGEYAVPLLVLEEPSHRTLLHVAVGARQHEIVEWLMDSSNNFKREEIEKMLCTRCRIGRRAAQRSHSAATNWTPLSHAVQLKDPVLVELLLSHASCGWHFSQELNDVFQEARASADSQFKAILNATWRELGVEIFFHQHLAKGIPLHDLKDAVALTDWWHEVGRPWTEKESFQLYLALVRSASKGLSEEVAWLMDEWGVSFERPRNFVETGTSVADWAAIGDETMIRGLTHPGTVSALKDDLDSWFRNFAFQELDGISTLRSYVEFHLAGGWSGPMRYMPYQQKTYLETWLKRLKDDTHIKRVQVLKLLIDRQGSAALPRLDLLVLADHLEVLQWLISEHYIDLDACLPGENPDEPKQESNVITSEVHESDDCAICLEPKRNPASLPCSHTFCRQCLRSHFGRPEHWIHALCPLCRSVCTLHALQPGNNILDRFEQSLPQTAPWLSNMCEVGGRKLLDVILCFAVGTGAIRIVIWLLSEHQLKDLKFARFSKGNSLMHIAVLRGQAYVVKYLVETVCHDMATFLNDKGMAPVHQAAREGNVSLLRYFSSKGLLEIQDALGREWTHYAQNSSSNEVKEVIKDYLAESFAGMLPKALQDEASLEYIVHLVESADLVKWAFQIDFFKNIFRGFVVGVIILGRVDVLRWLYTTDKVRFDYKSCQLFDVKYPFSAFGRQLSSSAASHKDELHALFDEVDFVDRIWDICCQQHKQFERLFEEGAPTRELADICQAQEVSLGRIIKDHPDFKFKFEGLSCDMNEITMHGRTPLEYATELDHVHIVEWLLIEKWDANRDEALRTLHTACSLGSFKVVEWLVPWMVKHHIDPNAQPSVRASGVGHAGQKGVNGEESMDNAFHTVLPLFIISSRETSAANDASKNEDRSQNYWKILQYLSGQPAVDVNAESLQGEHTVKHICRYAYLFRTLGEQFVMNLLKFLVQSGVDIPETKCCEKSLVEVLANYGCMEVVSWLALDLKIDIQHMSPDFRLGGFDLKQIEDLKGSFMSLQVAQKQQCTTHSAGGSAQRRRNRRRGR